MAAYADHFPHAFPGVSSSAWPWPVRSLRSGVLLLDEPFSALDPGCANR